MRTNLKHFLRAAFLACITLFTTSSAFGGSLADKAKQFAERVDEAEAKIKKEAKDAKQKAKETKEMLKKKGEEVSESIKKENQQAAEQLTEIKERAKKSAHKAIDSL